MKTALLLLCILCTLFVSCDKSGPTGYGSLDMDPLFNVGAQITYSWSLTVIDSAGNTTSSRSDTVDVTVMSTNDIVGDLDSLVRIEVFSHASHGTSATWYQMSGSDFVEVAYRFGLSGTPLAQPIILTMSGTSLSRRIAFLHTTPAIMKALSAGEVVVDSIYIRDDPRIVYRYPLVPGKQWTSFVHPFLQLREVRADSAIVVNGNPEQCVVIQTTLPDVASNLVWLDFVNREGLRKRSLIFQDLMVSTEQNPEGSYLATAYEILEIISPSSLNP